MMIGDICRMTSWRHRQSNGHGGWLEMTFKAPRRDEIGCFLFLGTEKRDGSQPMDYEKRLNELGWVRK